MFPFKRKHRRNSVIRNGLVLYLDGRDFLNSPPTSSWIDKSGNGNNATPSNFGYITSSGSDNNGGIVFDGVDDAAIINSSPSLVSFTNELTIMCKGKFKNGMITGKSSSLNLRTATGCLSCLILVDGATTLNTISNFVPDQSKTYIYAFTFKNKQGHLFVDSVEQTYSAQPIATNGVISNDNSVLFIGKRADTSPINATINDVLIYNRALSQLEIIQNCKALR